MAANFRGSLRPTRLRRCCSSASSRVLLEREALHHHVCLAAMLVRANTGALEVILFNLCGHGHFDMAAYTSYFAGELSDHEYGEQELAMALSGLPSVSV